MKYVEKDYLCCRGAVDQEEPEEVPVFMIGENYIADWESGQCRYGSNYNYLFPTFGEEGRGFLLRSKWCPGEGYCASGTEEKLISFEEGIKLLCEHGIYPWLKEEK